MEKKKLRMHLKDNYANISGVYIKYFKAETLVGTPTPLHSTLESRRGGSLALD